MPPNNDDPLITQVDDFLRQQARSQASLKAMKTLVPAMQAALELAAHRTILAIQCSFLGSDTLQRLRDALDFADACAHIESEHNQERNQGHDYDYDH